MFRRVAFLVVVPLLVPFAGASSAPLSAELQVPAGFRATVHVSSLTKPTALAYGPDGRLYVAQETGEIVAVGRDGAKRVFADGFRTPLGLAWFGRTLFVSEQGALGRLRLGARGEAYGRATLVAGVPYGRHQQDNVVVGRDGRLYWGSGSTCDVCAERDRRNGAVLSLRRDGRDLRVEATGLRNPFGLAKDPRSGRIYVSVNNRDDLGMSEPAEMIVVLRRGADYGWPGCWPSWRQRRLAGSCAGVTPPLAYLEPHSSPNGLVVYRDRAFPAAYRGLLFVAEWGQYYEKRWGRKVVTVDPRTGRTRLFADGFDHPLAVAVDPRGALLVADWGRGTVYRIQARKSS